METAAQRRERVTALVVARFPAALAPNRFANAILDIVRGGHGFDPEDRLEAIDALTERHLPASTTWGPNGGR